MIIYDIILFPIFHFLAVHDLQKKWKHLRDYFVREKNREHFKSRSFLPKKRKTPYLDLLKFLNVPRQSRVPSSNISTPLSLKDNSISIINEDSLDNQDSKEMTPHSSSNKRALLSNQKEEQTSPIDNSKLTLNEDSSVIHDSCCMTSLSSSNKKTSLSSDKSSTLSQESLLNLMERKDYDINPNLNFLLSLLPEMQTMSQRQLFDFKFETMKIVKKIKYSDD